MLIRIARFALDSLGFKTDRKLIAFCSDDWGGVRIKSLHNRERLLQGGINLNGNRFDQFDTLESNVDLEHLFDILLRHKDCKGNYPVLTVVMNVANPDFAKIRAGNFEEYYFESFTETLMRYPGRERVFPLYQQGLSLNIFKPQFHGREHVQVASWMRALRANDYKTRLGFDSDFFFLPKADVELMIAGEFAEAFNFWDVAEVDKQRQILASGIELFKSIFSYSPTYFTAPALIFGDELNCTLSDNGVRLIDVPKLRLVPSGRGRHYRKFHYLGQKNDLGQRYITRNAVFEPNLPGYDNQACLNQIAHAFRFRQPAIISNHRASLVGGIDENNRRMGLQKLDELLREILKRWPEVEFVDMDQLSQLMNDKC